MKKSIQKNWTNKPIKQTNKSKISKQKGTLGRKIIFRRIFFQSLFNWINKQINKRTKKPRWWRHQCRETQSRDSIRQNQTESGVTWQTWSKQKVWVDWNDVSRVRGWRPKQREGPSNWYKLCGCLSQNGLYSNSQQFFGNRKKKKKMFRSKLLMFSGKFLLPSKMEEFFQINVHLFTSKLCNYNYDVRRKFHATPPYTPYYRKNILLTLLKVP